VMYVGITQASLCNKLGADARVSNLPATFYFAMTAMPALIVWLFPHVRHLKWTICLCYAAVAASMLFVAFALTTDIPNTAKIGLVILQGAISGAAGPTAIALLWEVIGRGTDESRRGQALGLAFGFGPILAVIGSLGQVYMLGGDLFGWKFDGLGYPNGFVWLFGLGAPAMLLGSLCGAICIVPQPDFEHPRKPISDVMSLLVGLALGCTALALFFISTGMKDEALAGQYKQFGFGLLVAASLAVVYHFRDILTQRTLLIATIVTILVYSGNTIPSNMNLYSEFALGDAPSNFAGQQNTLRFSFKVVAGLLLGFLLTKTNPRAGIFATAGIYVAAMVWAILATGKAYLVAFGIFGAGELIGVYCPNYMLSASRKEDIRRAMAFVTMLMVPAAPTGYMFGAIVDALKPIKGAQFAFRTSFAVCALMILSGIILALCMLPAKPSAAAEPSRLAQGEEGTANER
jgi:MFS family permease